MDRTASGAMQRPMPDAERQLRIDLAACFRLIALDGLDDGIFTHVSARIPGPDKHFLINPYGMLFSEITASTLVKVGLDGHKVEPSDYDVAPAAFTIHSAVHMVRADVQCVIHLHTIDGQAVSAMEGGLLPLTQTSMMVCDDLATHEFEGPALDLAERARLQADLGEKNAMLLWNHGTLTLGATVPEAYVRMNFFERACSVQVRALAAGKLHLPSADARAKNVAISRNRNHMQSMSVDLIWPALLRKLDREAPDFRT